MSRRVARFSWRYVALKRRRHGLPVPDLIAVMANAERRRSRKPTGRPRGRPITSSHPRAEYWREWKRKRKQERGHAS